MIGAGAGPVVVTPPRHSWRRGEAALMVENALDMLNELHSEGAA